MSNKARHEAEDLDLQVERTCRLVRHRETVRALEDSSVLADTWATLPTDIRRSVGEATLASAERTWW